MPICRPLAFQRGNRGEDARLGPEVGLAPRQLELCLDAAEGGVAILVPLHGVDRGANRGRSETGCSGRATLGNSAEVGNPIGRGAAIPPILAHYSYADDLSVRSTRAPRMTCAGRHMPAAAWYSPAPAGIATVSFGAVQRRLWPVLRSGLDGEVYNPTTMTIAGTPDALTMVLVAAILGVVLVPVALMILAGLLSLIRRLGVNLGPAPAVLLLLGLPVALWATSMELDRSGQATIAQVIDKSENVRVREQGDWSDDLALTVRFANDGAPLPPVLSTGAALGEVTSAGGAMSTARMRVDSRHFDALAIGDPVDLRVLPLRSGVSLVRPADVSTRSMLPAGTLEWGGGLAAVLFLGLRLRRHRVGAAILVGLAVAAGVYPLYHADQLWREREDLSRATQRSSATIVDTARVVEINVLPNDVENADWNRHQVPQPYDIVQLELRPPGFPDPVTAIDAIDASTASGRASGQQVSVVYPPDDPHLARIEKQTRTHYWQTMRGVYTDYVVYAAGLIVLVLAAHFITRAYRARHAVGPSS
jgi:hypothetical protein